jgi:hypothetical protein
MDKNVLKQVAEALVETLEKRQGRANQYVVAYKKKSNDELIGYHTDSFCSLTDDILKAKRHAGENPDRQLKIIWDNLQATLDSSEENPGFLGISYIVKKQYWLDVDREDLYIDAIYMADGVPPQSFQAIISDPKDNEDGRVPDTER